MNRIYVLICFCLFATSCKTNTTKEKPKASLATPVHPKDSLSLIEAEQFKVFEYDSFKLLKVYNQLGKTQKRYLLYKETLPTTSLPYDLALQIPLKRIISRSTKYAGFIALLNETDKVVGFSGGKYVSNKKISQKIKEKEILEVGNDNGSGINFEALVSLEPDAIFTYDASLYGGDNASEQKMAELGLPVLLCNETLESTPLAQAEWIKYFGLLLGKEEKADKIFNNVQKRYDSLKNLVAKIPNKDKPTIFFNMWYGDTWFIPRANSYVAQFANDAGAKYIYQDIKGKGNAPLAIEAVYEKANEADYWFHPSNLTKRNQLISTDRRFVSFKALKTKNVFNHTKRQNSAGGNDYFESGVALPDKILEDWIKIIHPSMIKNSNQLYFYERLK